MRKIVLFLLFISGFSSLMYQILFTRLFNTVFGLFIHSTVIVVATYMLGLGIGYFLARNIKPKNNLSFYGYLEILIGFYSVVVFLIFRYIDSFYVLLGNNLIVKFILSSVILLLPTTAMGITIPIVVEFLKKTENDEFIDKVYGINALGASIGALLTSILFVNLIGLSLTFLIAFILNLVVFIVALVITRYYSPSVEFVKSDFKIINIGVGFGVVAFLFGFSGMALEILWYRLLVYFVANNTFSFSIILSVIIVGISLGALLYKPFLKFLKNDFYLLISVSFFTGVYVMFSLFILNSSYAIMGWLYNFFGNIFFGIFGDTKFSETISLLFTKYGLVLITSGIIAFSSGIIIPSIFNISRGSVGEDINSQSISGTILAFNTLGSIVGVFTITYFMIPVLGFGNSLLVISLVYLVSGFVVMLSMGCNRVLGIIGFVLALIVIVLPKEITFTKYYNGFFNVKGDLKFYKEGMYGTIAVFDVNKTRFLKINGIDEVPDDYNSLIAFKVLGNTPFLLEDKFSNVMVNALGGGITLSSVLHHITTQSITVVDICPDVVDALPLYSNHNLNTLNKRIWHFVEDDGRNFLKSYKGKFDIIIADATHPASADSWMLFTKEFYSLAYEKLNDNGIFAQWIPLHNLEVYDFVSILKTIRKVFPNAVLMVTGVYTVVISKKGDFDKFEVKSQDFGDLSSIGVSNEDDFKSLVFLSPQLFDMLINREKGEVLSDFKSSVEFAEFHRRVAQDTKAKNLSIIMKYSTPLELSRFTGLDPKKHYSMILSKQALLEYWAYSHYESLKKIDKSLELNPNNFYSKYLFTIVFPEFVSFVYKYEKQIKEKYGVEVYTELVRYIQEKMKNIGMVHLPQH